MQLKFNKYIFVIYSSLLLIFFLLIGGGPVTNDEIKFIYFANFNVLPIDLIGRFGHIYLLKFILLLNFDPIFSSTLLWALVISLTNYFIIKIIFQLTEDSYLYAFTGSILFLIHTVISKNLGVLYSDTILMLYFTLFIFFGIKIYHLSNDLINNKNIYNYSVITLFLLFYTSVITKPTAIVLFLPLIYLFISLKKNLFFEFLLGILCLFIFLFLTSFFDYLITKDFFYKFNFKTLDNSIANNLFNKKYFSENTNWFSAIFISPFIFIFFNFIIWSLKIDRNNKVLTLIFLTIISLLLFLSFIIYFSPRVIIRHFLPAYPLLCIINMLLLKHYLSNIKFNELLQIRDFKFFYLIIISVIILIIIITYILIYHRYDWTISNLAKFIIYPSIILVLFFGKIINEKIYSLLFCSIYFFYVFSLLIFFPQNISYAKNKYDARVEPLNYFLENIEYEKGSNLLMSESFMSDKNNAGRETLLKILTNEEINIFNSGSAYLHTVNQFEFIITRDNENLKELNINNSNYDKLFYKNFIYYLRK